MSPPPSAQDVTKQAGKAVKALEKVVTQTLEPARVVQEEWTLILKKDAEAEAEAREVEEREREERAKAEEEKRRAEAVKAKRKAAEELAKKAEFEAKVKAKRESVSGGSFTQGSGSPPKR